MKQSAILTIFFIISTCAILLVAGCTAGDRGAADTVYINGTIWTGAAPGEIAEAMAVRGDRIIAVGSSEQVSRFKRDQTNVVDLNGRFVVPGFIDSHTHFVTGGLKLASVNLRNARSQSEFVAKMEAFAKGIETERWITGGDWDHEAWGGDLPRKDWIDDVTGKHPVFVSRLDGHMALANSIALDLAGISASTADPDGGTIVRDPLTGQPTGVLKDAAMNLVFAIQPVVSEAELDEALQRAMKHASEKGVTQIMNMSGWEHLQTIQRAADAQQLRLRVYSFVPLSSWARLKDFVDKNGRGDDWHRWGGLKGFVDGSLGSTTAWFYDPYLDEPQTSGLLTTDTTALRNWIGSADAAGLHVAVHAIGDKANDWLLDTYATIAKDQGSRERRFRIEHAQHLTREAMERFGEMGVIPAMQPYHAIDDGRWAEKRIGAERIKTTYAFRSLIDSGAKLSFGSDWTVAPISPLEGIYAAVTRRTLDGHNPDGWVAEEKITVEEALTAYTRNNAYAGWHEEKTGSLEAGKLADFVVLSENLLRINPVAIADVKVLLTVVGGKVQYRHSDNL